MRKRIVLASLMATMALMLAGSLLAYADISCPMQGKANCSQNMKSKFQGVGKMHKQGKFAAKSPFAFLNLTQDQKKEMAEIRKSHREDIRPIQSKIMAKRAELKKLLTAQEPNRGKIKDTAREVSNLRGKMMEAKVDSLLKAREVLTPMQREKLANQLQKMDGKVCKSGKGCEGMKCQ